MFLLIIEFFGAKLGKNVPISSGFLQCGMRSIPLSRSKKAGNRRIFFSLHRPTFVFAAKVPDQWIALKRFIEDAGDVARLAGCVFGIRRSKNSIGRSVTFCCAKPLASI